MPIEALILLCIVGFVLTSIVLVRVHRKSRWTQPQRDIYAEFAEHAYNDPRSTRRRVDDAINAKYGVSSAEEDLEKPFRVARENVEKYPPKVAPHPKPLSDHAQTRPGLKLSRIDLGHINIQRRAKGKPPLNIYGFRRAIATAAASPVRQPDNSSDWFTYLILYECLFDTDHQSHVEVDTNLHIDPDVPFNGQGGDFSGAGASGSWSNAGPGDQPTTGSDPYGIVSNPRAGLNDDGGGKAGPDDPTPAAAPDPSPSYSAPDPSPSSSDSSSSSNDSSSSYDSGGSSSGGSDSGSSSGGGGDGS